MNDYYPPLGNEVLAGLSVVACQRLPTKFMTHIKLELMKIHKPVA